MTRPPDITRPVWADTLRGQYESGAVSQFLLYGNIHDRLVVPGEGGTPRLGDLEDYLLRVLLPRFDVILTYDLGNGLRVERGRERFAGWPALKDDPTLPRSPLAAAQLLTRYFRYVGNLARLGRERLHVALMLRDAHLVIPRLDGGLNYELGALALLVRGWSSDDLLTGHPLATFLLTDTLNDLHPLLVNNARASRLEIPMPGADQVRQALEVLRQTCPPALSALGSDLSGAARQLAGAGLISVEQMVRSAAHAHRPIQPDDLTRLKKELVERDSQELIEFVEPTRTLDDLHGLERVKEWLRQDIALGRAGDLQALPMGYLLCGPVGTGKTFLVECLAGEAGMPVVKIKNFRDRWVGSTESNLERIFRLLHALGRCLVFIDEADQALGRRDAGSADAGLSGRVYSMMAKEMSNTENRGRVTWVLASSRPDLIEVDLKRPGRVDVKIPIFPTLTPEESYLLLRALCRRRGLDLPAAPPPELTPVLPVQLTPGAAEALAVKAYRLTRTAGLDPVAATAACLKDYQSPVPEEVMEFQIGLAVREASDLEFVPPVLRPARRQE